MKVLVLGAGVIGVTTAYYLAKAGFEVTVIDRQPGPGLETSFANAGEVSPGYASPWAGPSVPARRCGWMLDRHGPLVVRPQADPAMWRWIFQMLRNCTASRYALNKSRMVGIAEYSRDCLRELRADIGISYDERSQGTLQLFRKQSQLDATGGDIDVLQAVQRALSRCWIAPAASAPSRAWPAVQDQLRRRAAAARRRDRRLPSVHAAAGEDRGRARRAASSTGRRSRRSTSRAAASRRSRPTRASSRPIAM